MARAGLLSPASRIRHGTRPWHLAASKDFGETSRARTIPDKTLTPFASTVPVAARTLEQRDTPLRIQIGLGDPQHVSHRGHEPCSTTARKYASCLRLGSALFFMRRNQMFRAETDYGRSGRPTTLVQNRRKLSTPAQSQSRARPSSVQCIQQVPARSAFMRRTIGFRVGEVL